MVGKHHISTRCTSSVCSSFEETSKILHRPAVKPSEIKTLDECLLVPKSSVAYFLDEHPSKKRIFGIDGKRDLYEMPEWLYQKLAQKIPNIESAEEIPLKVILRYYNKNRGSKQQPF